jgi:hypothetical protein
MRAPAALTARNRRDLLAIRAVVLRRLQVLWPSFRPDDLASWDRFNYLASVLVRAGNRDAAGIAARYFEQCRTAAAVPGVVVPQLALEPPMDMLARSLTATGLVGTIRALSVGYSEDAALANGFVRLAGAATRYVLDGARDTITASTARDPRAPRWQRVTGGNPCDFCQMLEGRGAVYSEETAGFESHDHCVCSAEPVWPEGR